MNPAPLPLCGTLLYQGARALDTAHGRFIAHAFHDLALHRPLLAVLRGACDGPTPLLARVHSSCMTGESAGAADCDCAEQLDAALARIAAAGRGALFYLLQEGRGAGFIAKARDRMLVQASRDRVTTFDAYAHLGLDRDYRRYETVAYAAAALNLSAPLRVLSNNPDKLAALRSAGVAIAGSEPLRHAPSPFNVSYLTAKSRSGHALGEPAAAAIAAEPPEAVEVCEPTAVPGLPHLLRVASYLLPVRALPPAEGAYWLRVHAYIDRETGGERIVLTVPQPADVTPLVHVHADTLLGRFPASSHPAHDWRTAVARLAERGAGAALLLVHDDPPRPPEDVDAAALAAEHPDLVRLLAAHLPGRAELLVPHAALAAALRAAGVVVEAAAA